ncbi:hypothetical protein AB0H60_33300 [Nocardia rhamnosiphila]|uniref:hypothetical protein n=1 Tax=Nocardia rhamnosiphila TaxID=426716 RepID=UPI0033E690EF
MLDSSVRLAICIGSEWTELTNSSRQQTAVSSELIRIQADDLPAAQKITARLHSEARAEGRTATVFLDLEVHTAADARTARSEAAGLALPEPRSVRYIGTDSGLLGLISDIKITGVADGVTLIFLGPTDHVPGVIDAAVA